MPLITTQTGFENFDIVQEFHDLHDLMIAAEGLSVSLDEADEADE